MGHHAERFLGDITSDILCLSFDSASSPFIKIKLPEQLYGSHPLGWGVAWYPNDSQAAIVQKDPAARGADIQIDALEDWDNYRSSVFFCKAKGAAKGYTHHETQPFSRSFAGHDWLFMHNGDLDKEKLAKLHTDKSRFLEPVGKTDSELAFCYLLGKMMETDARRLGDVPYDILLGWFEQLDALGSADMCISDGVTIAVFYGSKSVRKLYYTRQQPPQQVQHFNSETMQLDLGDSRDSYRTALIVASSPFDAGNWLEMQPRQLLVARRGALVWNSQPSLHQPHQIPLAFPAANTGRKLGNFAPMQAEQAQKMHQSVMNIRSITRTEEGRTLGFRTFDITHETTYQYTSPVEHSTHTFRLQPLEDPVQEVVRSTFTITSQGEEIRYEDVFGNQSIYYSINIPYTELKIKSTSRVKVFDTPPDDHSLSLRKSSIPLVWMPWQRQMMMPYLLPAELPETQLRELTDYAMSFVRRNDFHLMETLKDINLSIYRDYRYMPGTTSLYTTPFEVYAGRQGVCQDFANLFICLAQLLGIPARYRMGYIFTHMFHENKIQSDASHAWVEIYIPYVGWRGFDPTNGCMVAQDHVRVAAGRNYRDATPTSGTIFKGGGFETLTVDVTMNEVTG
jgi:transglutaminase-like putative cysteine protease/predicted glutamine amidotransferase